MRVYHVTYGKHRLKSILSKGLLPSSSKVLAEEGEETKSKIFFGRTVEESREQADLTDHPVYGDEIVLTVDLPEGYKLSKDKWRYLYGRKRVDPSRIVGVLNITEKLRSIGAGYLEVKK